MFSERFFALREVSVPAELALGHLSYHLTDVPPQSNSPPRNVLGADLDLTTKLGQKVSVKCFRNGPGHKTFITNLAARSRVGLSCASSDAQDPFTAASTDADSIVDHGMTLKSK